MPQDSLLRTKLYIPPIRPELVPRPRQSLSVHLRLTRPSRLGG